jgi:hypothetical protein
MNLRHALVITLCAIVFSAMSPSTLRALQRTVTAADIQLLHDGVLDAGAELARLRVKDADRARQLETELDVLREDVTYLRAMLRREGKVPPADYDDIQKRLNTLRQTARTALTGVIASAPAAGPNDVPVGTEIDVRLQSALSSKTAQVEDRFEATTVLNVDNAERILIPAGSLLRGLVSSVDSAGKVDRTGRLALVFDQITVRGRTYPIRATVIQALESEGIRSEAGRIGAGAGVGAVLGGILGGLKGAITGILVGAGGVIAATEGVDVTLAPGTILRIRLDTPLSLPEAVTSR